MTTIKTWEERVKELEDLGATRSDAQAVIDAEDIYENTPMRPETFAIRNSLSCQKTKLIQKMAENISKRNCFTH